MLISILICSTSRRIRFRTYGNPIVLNFLDTENCLETLTQRSITRGSSERIIPDIILRIENQDVFDIELKQYNRFFDIGFEKQLISYLNQTHISSGMIVCRSIYLYSYDYVKNTVDKITIPFKEDNPDGIRLMEIISRDNYSSENIKEFIFQKKTSISNVETIKNAVNNELINSLLVDYFRNDYSDNEINEAMSMLSISIYKQDKVLAEEETIINRDYTKTKNSKERSASGPLSYEEIADYCIEWCRKKHNEGSIIYSDNDTNSQKNLMRFSTERMNSFLPAYDDRDVLWKNRHYFYEIVLRGDVIKMWISINNKSTKRYLHELNQLLEFGQKYPSNPDWAWQSPWATKPARKDSIVSKEHLYQILDNQFLFIMKNEDDFFKYINM